jgi:hypothetical protein
MRGQDNEQSLLSRRLRCLGGVGRLDVALVAYLLGLGVAMLVPEQHRIAFAHWLTTAFETALGLLVMAALFLAALVVASFPPRGLTSTWTRPRRDLANDVNVSGHGAELAAERLLLG